MKLPRFISLCTWLAFLVFSIVIVSAARGDLWFDEIWSLSLARKAKTIADVFIRLHHDNNHPLNTLFLYCMGDQKGLIVYRLLSVLAGLGSLLLAGHVARRDWGHTEALCSMVFMGSSYPLLIYFSEARGYALAIFLGLASYAALGLPRERNSWKQVALFWSTSVLGILAHASFVMLSLAFALWGVAREFQVGERRGRAARRLIVLHATPLLFFACWYLYFLKDMTVLGGPEYGTWSVIGQASVLILGLADSPALRGVAPFLGLLVVVLGSTILYRRRDIRWSFFPAVIIISPTLLILVADPRYLYFRYFIVCFPFVILLLAYIVGSGCHSFRRHWRWLAFAVLAGFLVGQLPRDYQLLKLGRGQYAAALEFIAAQPHGRDILVGTDQDLRNRVLFDFYAPRVTGGGDLRYVTKRQWRSEHPDWIIIHSEDVFYRTTKEITVIGVGTYRLVKQYRFSGISGWSWFLYRGNE